MTLEDGWALRSLISYELGAKPLLEWGVVLCGGLWLLLEYGPFLWVGLWADSGRGVLLSV